MKDISNIDKNLKVETEIQKEGIKFYDVLEEPFKVCGVFKEGEYFTRMPDEVAKTVSAGVKYGARYTSGGRVRFRTNSTYVAIHYKGEMGRLPFMADTGSGGFDIYTGTKFKGAFTPPAQNKSGYESVVEFGNSEIKEITINFPLYSFVRDLYIGLDENALVEAPTDYKVEKPVVFYGSSITMGGCASRPGAIYQQYVSRRFDCDFVNLGFSGNAKAEVEIAEYIASLDMSLFVFDYDHNSPSLEHLEETHERLFKMVREKHPDVPVVIMSKPKFELDAYQIKRLEIIRKTCDNARAAGDRNVYFIDGRELFSLCEHEGLVDGCHPTDLGFFSMAKKLVEVIEENKIL